MGIWIYFENGGRRKGIDVIVPHGAIINDLLLKENIYQVDSETVGQYTGLTDINGKRIYEGDIVTLNLCKKYEIIGNIYDNPELLAEQLKNLKINS